MRNRRHGTRLRESYLLHIHDTSVDLSICELETFRLTAQMNGYAGTRTNDQRGGVPAPGGAPLLVLYTSSTQRASCEKFVRSLRGSIKKSFETFA